MRYCNLMKRYKNILSSFSIVLANLFFWIAVYFFYTYFLGYGSSNTEYVNRFSAYLMPVTILLSYFVIFVLIRDYLRKRKYKLFILYGIYTLIISFSGIIISIFYGLVFSSYLKELNTEALTKSITLIVMGVYFVVIVAVFLSLLVFSYLSSMKSEDLKNRFLHAQLQLKEQELKFLKMQIHPHFLFNSLNTIYGFALQKREEAPEMILKLSNLLDYILYQIQKPTVFLEDEWNHLEDYIALEKMRFHDTLAVTIEKEIDQPEVLMAPMLLIPFVENSFKHGSIIDGFLTIALSLKVKNDELIFYIENSTNNSEKENAGIGLENIKRRLEMLYPNAYEMSISEPKNKFIVNVRIQTNKLKNLKKENEG